MPIKFGTYALMLSAFLCLAFNLNGAEKLPTPGNEVSIFDGQSMAGWEGDLKIWRVSDAAFTGGSLTETVKQNEFLATRRDYTNFIVRFKIKLTGAEGFINSGFQIRSQRDPKSSEMIGYQCDFGDPNWWGAIYDESRRNKVLAPSDMTAIGPVIRRNDWNDYVIRADGWRITTWINGVQATDFHEPDATLPDYGKLGIQVHGGGKALVQVKDVRVEELPVSPGRFVGAPEPAKSNSFEPLEPHQERATFTLPPGFEIELVAAESEGIGKFVAVDWDLQGRMWSMTALEYPVDGNENPAAAGALYKSVARDKVVVWDQPFKSGPHLARVFAEGLAIPLGILPYADGVYVQHGPDIAFLRDTDGDGKSDKRETILTGFGVQDSHLFPHQFTRAPGNWIWMAQGAFNYGKVRTTRGVEQQFDQTRMARFRYDGSAFDITSQGPCNIWGLVINGEGEAFIQEANDYGYPVMPFHAQANYPGCSDAQFKSYAPEYPGTAPDFQMGGTGLSGLALSDAAGAWPAPYADVMYVANPITRKIQAIKIDRRPAGYRFQKLPDFVRSSDEMFRPVAIRTGPDGCLYIVDWYNKIISHNEVPRTHPERDKKRGRIWRVKHRDQKPFPVPDFTKIAAEDLLKKLGGDSVAQSHMAWQAITDRKLVSLVPDLMEMMRNTSLTSGRRIGALWALEGLRKLDLAAVGPMLVSPNRNARREAVRALGESDVAPRDILQAISPMSNDADPEVRAEVIRTAARFIESEPSLAIALCLKPNLAPLNLPVGKSTQSGKTIKIGEAYEREFERYLARLFLESHPAQVAAYLDSPDAAGLTSENRMLAALALQPSPSAQRVARLLPSLKRPPSDEELLRLINQADQPEVADTLKNILQNPETRTGALESFLKVRSRIEPAKVGSKSLIGSMLQEISRDLLKQHETAQILGLKTIAAFKLVELSPSVDQQLLKATSTPSAREGLRTLRELGGGEISGIEAQIKNPDRAVADDALQTLATSKNPAAPSLLLEKYWVDLSFVQRRKILFLLAGTKVGGTAILKSVKAASLDKEDLDGNVLDKLNATLPGNGDLLALQQELSGVMQPLLRLNGKDDSWIDSGIRLQGAFTVETWVKLDPGIDNNDGLLGAPGILDLNFFDSTFRVWTAGGDVAVAVKKMIPNAWVHLAVTRDLAGKITLYVNGDKQSQSAAPVTPVTATFEQLRIGWSGPGQGTAGWLTEFRVWNVERSSAEILSNMDRSFLGETRPSQLIHYFSGESTGWGKLNGSAAVEKSRSFPPLVSAVEASARTAKFDRYRVLAARTGEVNNGKTVFTTLCSSCHNVGGQGGQVGPVLNGAGALGVESLLRNILTPSSAMEPAYRVYRAETREGDLVEGILISSNDQNLVIRRPNSEDLRLPQEQVRRADFLNTSMMPEGLLDGLTEQQVGDLFAYLLTLK